MTRVNKSGKRIPIFTPLNENANDLVRGYFMRDSEGGYAPKNFKINNNAEKNKKIRAVRAREIQALHNPSIMMQKPYKKSTKKKK
jgi:hypothetical protein